MFIFHALHCMHDLREKKTLCPHRTFYFCTMLRGSLGTEIPPCGMFVLWCLVSISSIRQKRRERRAIKFGVRNVKLGNCQIPILVV